jgi:hypothetical protein
MDPTKKTTVSLREYEDALIKKKIIFRELYHYQNLAREIERKIQEYEGLLDKLNSLEVSQILLQFHQQQTNQKMMLRLYLNKIVLRDYHNQILNKKQKLPLVLNHLIRDLFILTIILIFSTTILQLIPPSTILFPLTKSILEIILSQTPPRGDTFQSIVSFVLSSLQIILCIYTIHPGLLLLLFTGDYITFILWFIVTIVWFINPTIGIVVLPCIILLVELVILIFLACRENLKNISLLLLRITISIILLPPLLKEFKP